MISDKDANLCEKCCNITAVALMPNMGCPRCCPYNYKNRVVRDKMSTELTAQQIVDALNKPACRKVCERAWPGFSGAETVPARLDIVWIRQNGPGNYCEPASVVSHFVYTAEEAHGLCFFRESGTGYYSYIGRDAGFLAKNESRFLACVAALEALEPREPERATDGKIDEWLADGDHRSLYRELKSERARKGVKP